MGFSIIITNVSNRGGNAMAIFYRRMFFLMLIGFAHLMLVWSGDILMLYSFMGMILPLFSKGFRQGAATHGGIPAFPAGDT